MTVALHPTHLLAHFVVASFLSVRAVDLRHGCVVRSVTLRDCKRVGRILSSSGSNCTIYSFTVPKSQGQLGFRLKRHTSWQRVGGMSLRVTPDSFREVRPDLTSVVIRKGGKFTTNQSR